MDSRAELAEALAALVHAPESMLSRVFIERDDAAMRYTVLDENGKTIIVLDRMDLQGDSIQEVLERKFNSLICALCDVLLIDGEEAGLCGLCESKTVMELFRMGESLR